MSAFWPLTAVNFRPGKGRKRPDGAGRPWHSVTHPIVTLHGRRPMPAECRVFGDPLDGEFRQDTSRDRRGL